MDIFSDVKDLFSAQQKEILYQNHIPGKNLSNHNPVVRLYFHNSGHSFLLTELYKQYPMAYGLYEYDKSVGIGRALKKHHRKEIEIGKIDLNELKEMAIENIDALCIDDEFVGKYPLAVYAKVADECKTIMYHQDDDYLKNCFTKYAQGRNIDPSQSLRQLHTKLIW